jgi:hypothetical protein
MMVGAGVAWLDGHCGGAVFVPDELRNVAAVA